MLFIVATNVVASRPPEFQPTGTPDTRAKMKQFVQTYGPLDKQKYLLVTF